jgi:hypothetical protein
MLVVGKTLGEVKERSSRAASQGCGTETSVKLCLVRSGDSPPPLSLSVSLDGGPELCPHASARVSALVRACYVMMGLAGPGGAGLDGGGGAEAGGCGAGA